MVAFAVEPFTIRNELKTSRVSLQLIFFAVTASANEAFPSLWMYTFSVVPSYIAKLWPYTKAFASMVISPPNDDVPAISKVSSTCIAPVNEDVPPTSRVPAISMSPPNEPLPLVSNRIVSLLTLILVVAWTFPSMPRRRVDCTTSFVRSL